MNRTTRNIFNWRTRCNLILEMYLAGYLAASPSMQQQLPYHLDQEYGVLRDNDGRTVAEFVIVQSAVSVIWMASVSVLQSLDTHRKVLASQLESSIW